MSDFSLWILFTGGVLALIAVDLVVSARAPTTLRSALTWSAFWIGLAGAVGIGVLLVRGGDSAVEFYTGYLLEKALSIDNLFLFLLIFSRYRVPPSLWHRVLAWGILGAIVLRGIMIVAGVELLRAVHEIVYVLGAMLIWTGVKTLLEKEHGDAAAEEGRIARLVRRLVRVVPRYDGGRFFTRENGRRVGTLLLLVLVVIEASDLLFALDSIPAIFAITEDPFIVFSSNVLAVLGLRALFFAVGEILGRLRYLRHGLGVLLVLIGLKMGLSAWVHVPPLLSLALTMAVLGVAVVASLAAGPVRQKQVQSVGDRAA